jgi:hypothetical protein
MEAPMPPAVPAAVATLEFDPAHVTVGDDADVRAGLSAVVLDGPRLWLACDEGCRLDRLERQPGAGDRFGAHTIFPLEALLDLPAGSASEEADVEGLDVDDGWLWLVGSHSVKRKKPKADDSPAKVADKLAKTERDGNRHLLARIPLDAGGGLARSTADRRAGRLAATPTSSALLDAIAGSGDRHLRPFVDIPGKDNGLDIEGLAVRGMRAFVGLRGPVLREWSCVLELRLEAGPDGSLRLLPVDDGTPYRKHFLKVGGLGIRDLVWLEDDLLILAGPAMAHDGPIGIFRWAGAARPGPPAEARPLLTLPHGEGTDRAEGLTLLQDGGPASVLVVFDSPSAGRLVGDHGVKADVYRLP